MTPNADRIAELEAKLTACANKCFDCAKKYAGIVDKFIAADLRAENAEAQLAKCRRDAERLREFARDIMEDWPEGAPDGGALQDIAEKHGLLRSVLMQAPCCDPDDEHSLCSCADYGADFPTECYRKTSLLTGKPETDAAIDAALSARELG
jgi:hypothetical protein